MVVLTSRIADELNNNTVRPYICLASHVHFEYRQIYRQSFASLFLRINYNSYWLRLRHLEVDNNFLLGTLLSVIA